jgi:1-acyl-sn-glycerol-3-phosphate acyltransferase
MNDGKFIKRHPLRLTIHKPIYPLSQGHENIERLKKESYEAIGRGLEVNG